MLKAKLTLRDDDGSVMTSLCPESFRSLPRTEVDISRDGEELTVTVVASDTSAMRAALNSYLGWIRITENIDEMIQ